MNLGKRYWSGNELLVHAKNPCNWKTTQWCSMTAEDGGLVLAANMWQQTN